MRITKTPELAKKVFNRLTWEKNTDVKELYLTFDDGPTPGITEWILDLLDRFNAKATFFCLGKNVVLFPDLFEETLRRGHAVGNHTYSHLNGWKTVSKKYLEDIAACEKVFHSKLFRPPYGKLKPGTRTEILKKYEIIMWDVLSYDFDNSLKKEDCLSKTLKKTRSGSIVVFHDSEKAKANMQYCLPKILKHFSIRGFKFKVI